MLSQPTAHPGDAVLGASVVSGPPVSGDVEIDAAGDAGASVILISSRDPSTIVVHDLAGSAEATPRPHFAGLASHFLPFDRASLERAVDRFLDTFDSAADELTRIEPWSALLISAGTIALTSLTLDAIKRRGRTRDDEKSSQDEVRRAETALLRTLPNSWNWNLAER
jgi:hypothetical protein